MQPQADREKEEGFVLLVGSRPQMFEIAGDRDLAIDTAVKVLEENDTVVFVSKKMSRIGNVRIAKDQLILYKKENPSKGGM